MLNNSSTILNTKKIILKQFNWTMSPSLENLQNTPENAIFTNKVVFIYSCSLHKGNLMNVMSLKMLEKKEWLIKSINIKVIMFILIKASDDNSYKSKQYEQYQIP